jgi:hypothetical protein
MAAVALCQGYSRSCLVLPQGLLHGPTRLANTWSTIEPNREGSRGINGKGPNQNVIEAVAF